MKTKFIFVLVLALLIVGCQAEPASSVRDSPQAAESPDGGDAQRLVSLIDYVASDYGGAVKDGVVVSGFEYEEQLGFLETAIALVPRVLATAADRTPIAGRLEALQTAVRVKADASVVAQLGRSAREDIVSRLGIPTAPRQRPQKNNGEALYAQSCATCHGLDGLGETEVAAQLDPRPTSFKNRERGSALSPYRVYNSLTLGIPGTAMPGFEGLSSSERWDLAFHVLSLGHSGEPARGPVSMTLADLSMRSDAEVLATLHSEGHPSPSEGLAFARSVAPFKEAPLGLGIDQTRSKVRKAASLALAGNREAADRVALDAYLQGFEPLEAQLNARHPDQTRAVEIAFRDFRAALSRGNAASVESQARVLDERIAESGSATGSTLPFVAALVIYFREGLEAALIVGALLGGVKKLGRDDLSRAIHQGWVSALLAGGVSWLLFSKLVVISPSKRELVEAIIGLAAALLLFSVSFWMISKAESRKWMAFLKDRMNRGLDSGRAWSLVVVAFLAVFRECAETILFTEALLIEAAGKSGVVFAGAATGLAAVVLVALVIQKALRRLPMPVFFGVSGFLLSLLAIAFAGSSVSTFVAVGYLPPHPIRFPSFPMLGVHPDLSSLAVQLALVLLLAGGTVKAFLDSRQPDRV